MTRPWTPQDGVVIPSGAKSFARRFSGPVFCSGGMVDGELLRQEPHALDPNAPRHEYQGAPVKKCGSRRFCLAIHGKELYIRCDECGAPLDVVLLAP